MTERHDFSRAVQSLKMCPRFSASGVLSATSPVSASYLGDDASRACSTAPSVCAWELLCAWHRWNRICAQIACGNARQQPRRGAIG